MTFPLISPRALVLLLLSTAIFLYGCSSTSNLEDARAEQGANNLSEALRYANKATLDTPENASAHLLKAEIMQEYSRNFQPSDRADMYSDMTASLRRAADVARSDEQTTILERSEDLREIAYSYERKAAENVLQSDEVMAEENRRAVLAHLHNARIIQPAHPWSYNRLFEMHYEQDEADEALEVLLLMYEEDIATERHIEAIGFFYHEKQAYEEARHYLQEAWDEGRGHLNTGRGLANTLISLGKVEEAEVVLQRLSRVDGLRVETRLAYGRLLGEQAVQQLEDITQAPEHPAPADSLKSVQAVIEIAEQELEAAYDLDRDHTQTNYVLGLFHHNVAFGMQAFYHAYPFLEPERFEEQMGERLYNSLSYLEYAVEEQPDETLWQSLYNAYTYLDMREDAARAGAKIGLP